eukprot:GEMP01021739.1.p1 GENE.GEMP01021739.1~~GEMP01021739.1.p1  ORF type:complete len:376 (+),score=71.08 GEMP01021739.1:30-1157(+)
MSARSMMTSRDLPCTFSDASYDSDDCGELSIPAMECPSAETVETYIPLAASKVSKEHVNAVSLDRTNTQDAVADVRPTQPFLVARQCTKETSVPPADTVLFARQCTKDVSTSMIHGARGSKHVLVERAYTQDIIAGALAAVSTVSGDEAAGVEGRTAIIVPLGGTASNGEPNLWVQQRLRVAAQLYSDLRAEPSGKRPYVFVLSAGTSHKPLPIFNGWQVTEAEAASRWLLSNTDVAAEDLFEENTSRDTIGNFFFFRVQHFEYLDIRSMTIITCDWHMPRVKDIAEHVFSIDMRRQVPMEFIACVGTLSGQALVARRQKEETALRTWQKNRLELPTMRSVHNFIFQRHNAYMSRRLRRSSTKSKGLDVTALKTY